MAQNAQLTSPALHRAVIAAAADIQKRIQEMAVDIVASYAAQQPLFVCLLRGGAPFAAQLMFAITAHDPDFHPELDYMRVGAYGDGRIAKTPQVLSGLHPKTRIEGRTIILLDDVLDTGVTAAFCSNLLRKNGAAHVDLVVLAQKQQARTHWAQATLWGFETKNTWITGMGLDDARIAPEANRWLMQLAIANSD